MLVVKLKNDNQNVAFKKRIAELQAEIKSLSEEHKKMVVKVRESLVKSISQAHSGAVPTATSVGNQAQTITAIGQPRLVSFPTQGGATILPMGMMALPIAHMQQKSAVGMAIHPAGVTALTQAANISIIPAGIISSGCNLNFAAINGGASLTLNNVGGNIGPFCGAAVAQNFPSSGPASLGNNTVVSMATPGGVLQSSCPSSIASSASNGSIVNTHTTSSGVSNITAVPAMGILPNSSINLNNFTNMTSLIINNSIGSNHPLVINSSINNKTSPSTSTITTSSNGGVSSGGDPSVMASASIPSSNSSINSGGGSGFLVCPVPSLSAPSAQPGGSALGAPSLVLSSSFPQQPLVQPQLLQQQQQQIIQLIQQQQGPPQLQQQQPLHTQLPPPLPPPPPPPPQQRLASHLPIKVPQYTASHIRPVVNTALAQHNSITSSPTPSIVSQTKMSTTTSASSVKASTMVHKVTPAPTTPVKNPSISFLTNGNHVGKETKDAQVKSGSTKLPKPAQQKLQKESKTKSLQAPKEKAMTEPEAKPQSAEDKEKIKFMKALDLYTPEAVREVVMRRGERKRRTTANPNYSFGFEISRRDRYPSSWRTDLPAKKARTNKVKVEASERGWSDSTSSQHWAASKTSRQSDNHDDYCAACSKGGSLLMCSTCRLVYHLDCLNPPLTEAPKYAWSCPQCLVSGKGLANLSCEARKKVNSYIAKKADKEDEWKKTQKKSREIKTEKASLDRRLQEVNSKIQEQKQFQSKLSKQEQKIQEDLTKLSGFVNMLRESRSMEHTAASLVEANCS
ncbi:PHD finger protein 21A [Elysia marginata]|uniref:PHD finger protein 21A n=1 Tax=Elysia marginata TaxID=1093978 RepID=A0AAV4F7L7_9GAST|nr:PHD finger protein 21A [Elysia marginata]